MGQTHPAPTPPATAHPTEQALFDAPRDRLSRRLHDELFGCLTPSLRHALDQPEVAAAVRPLLARGWRPAQLSARVGALPDPGSDPVRAVVAFLEQLLARACPQEAWEREQQERSQEAAARAHGAPAPASDEVRAHWVAQARRSLGLPARSASVRPAPPARTCASCSGEGSFFVTREVRLCSACVELLGSGRAHLAVGA